MKRKLYSLTRYGDEDGVRDLIEKGVDINKRYMDTTPLENACETGKLKVVKILLENKANPNEHKSYTPLDNACSYGYIDIVKILLEYKANPDISFINPLALACQSGHFELVKFLFRKEDIKKPLPNVYGYGTSILDYAFQSADIEIIRFFIAKGATFSSFPKELHHQKMSRSLTRSWAQMLRYLVNEELKKILDFPCGSIVYEYAKYEYYPKWL
jgi:ankyrin